MTKDHSQTKRREREKLLKMFEARFWDDDDIADRPVIRKIRKRYQKLVEEGNAEESIAKQMLCWKAAFFDIYMDTQMIKALLKEAKLDIGVLGQGMNVLTGLLKAVVLGETKKQPHKGKKLPSKSLRLNDYAKRKSA